MTPVSESINEVDEDRQEKSFKSMMAKSLKSSSNNHHRQSSQLSRVNLNPTQNSIQKDFKKHEGSMEMTVGKRCSNMLNEEFKTHSEVDEKI